MEREEVLGEPAAKEVEEPLLLRCCRELELDLVIVDKGKGCLLYTSPSPRDS